MIPVRSTDEELMQLVREGRTEMLAILFERHHVRLYNFFLRLTGHRARSEDFTQEVFCRILSYRHTYDPGKPFSTWMYQIGRNLYRTQFRSPGLTAPLEEDAGQAPDPSPLEEVCRRELAGRLTRAMARLSVRKRELLVLSRFQNLKYAEIAAILDCSVEAVKTGIHRAIGDLRRWMSPGEEER